MDPIAEWLAKEITKNLQRQYDEICLTEGRPATPEEIAEYVAGVQSGRLIAGWH